jgi:hypothetical protein
MADIGRRGIARGALVLLGIGSALVMAEVLGRLAIGTHAPALISDPVNYADPLCDDAYWALRQRHASKTRERPFTHHDTLGWTLDPAHTNALGASQRPAVWSEAAPRLGMFGDSFVQGTTAADARLAVQLQTQIPAAQVLGYGVGGYGLDQIVLSLEAQLSTLMGGEAVVGVMLTDIDRSILHYRDGPKPWFSLDAGVLDLHVDHLGSETAEPQGPRSHFFGWIVHGAWPQLRALLGRPRPDCSVVEKTALTHALIGRAAASCAAHQVRCTLLTFPHIEAFQAPHGWRMEALVQAAAENGMPARDAGSIWTAAGLQAADIYGPDRHPSPAANAAVARALAQTLGHHPG